MEIKDECIIDAVRPEVWKALNDPEVLLHCIPGCTELEKISDTEFTALISSKIGPVKAKFASQIELSDIVPQTSYTLTGQGKGGVAGFGKGLAKILLCDHNEGTLLSYEAQMQVGGKLAQIGSRLVAGAANKLVGEFFNRFKSTVQVNK